MALGSTVNKIVDYEYRTSGTQAAGVQFDGLISKAAALAAAYKALDIAIDFTRDSVMAAVDANEDWNKFMVVMGDNAEMVNAQLEEFADTTNRNVYELRALTASVQDMLVPMGVARDEAAQLSTNFVQLATDVGSFNNVGTAEVLNAIQSALAGQSRPLRRFGVDTRVAALESQALAMGIRGTWQELDQATQAQVLYAKIVADTADAQGDATRTADEAANVMRGFQASVDRAKVEIGNNFLPVIEELTPRLEELGAEIFPLIMEAAQEVADALLTYGPEIIDTISDLVEAIQWLKQAAEDAQLASRIIEGIATVGISEGIRGIQELTEAQRIMRENAEWMDSIPFLPRVQDNGADVVGLFNSEADSVTGAGSSFLQMARDYETAQGTIEGAGPLIRDDDPMGLGKMDFAERARQQAEAEIAMLEAVDAKRAEITEMALMREEEVYTERMMALQGVADQSVGIIVGGFTGGFDQVIDGFKNMLGEMASEFLKSQILGAIFGGGKGLVTGGIGGFL